MCMPGKKGLIQVEIFLVLIIRKNNLKTVLRTFRVLC
jgi:hypothetical protein